MSRTILLVEDNPDDVKLTLRAFKTTSGEDRDLIESYKLGANSYARKPVDFLQFAEAIQQL